MPSSDSEHNVGQPLRVALLARLKPCPTWRIAALVLALPVMGLMGAKGADLSGLEKDCRLIHTKEMMKILPDPKAKKPVLLHIGFRSFFRAAHIPGSLFAGPASEPGGINLLKKEAQKIPRDEEIVLYCGCCPMEHCPNVRPACTVMKKLGFTKVRVLELPRSFEHDWMDKGLPIEKGSG